MLPEGQQRSSRWVLGDGEPRVSTVEACSTIIGALDVHRQVRDLSLALGVRLNARVWSACTDGWRFVVDQGNRGAARCGVSLGIFYADGHIDRGIQDVHHGAGRRVLRDGKVILGCTVVDRVHLPAQIGNDSLAVCVRNNVAARGAAENQRLLPFAFIRNRVSVAVIARARGEIIHVHHPVLVAVKRGNRHRDLDDVPVLVVSSEQQCPLEQQCPHRKP